jgi:hypothetical protein
MSDALGADAVSDGRVAERPDDIVSLAIEPGTIDVTVRDAMMSSQLLRAVAVRRDGMRTPLINGVWSIDNDRGATISVDGELRINGRAAGVAHVQVEAAGTGGMRLTASATVTITIERDFAIGGGTIAEHQRRFADAPARDPMQAANILYPLDGVVMPNNVAAPDIQWERGAPGDVYRVRLQKDHLRLTAYVVHTGMGFKYDWVAEPGIWRIVAESDIGLPVTLTVDRAIMAGGQVIGGDPVRMVITRAGIYGNVYYWYWTGSGVLEGFIMRVADGTAERTQAIPNIPPTPGAGGRCPGCHTVSRDGRYLATPLGGGVQGAAVFDFLSDLRANPSPTVFPTNTISGRFFFAFNPDSSRLLATNAGGQMALFNRSTGALVMNMGLPASNSIHPEWSPDGRTVAYIDRQDGGGDIFTSGNLTLLDQIDGELFGAPRMLHAGASLRMNAEGGTADAHPTWSPDSRVIAFAHGEHSYSGDSFTNLNDPRPFGGALYMIPKTGGEATRLSNASGGTMGRDSYWPTFSPFVSREGELGGLYWLAFMSRREYGNAQAGTRGARSRGRGGGRLQIWISAIDVNSVAGTDPSHAAYWLPGQDLATGNFAAYWAPVACRANAMECRLDGDCCSGRCRPDPMDPSRNICQPPPPAECRREGQTCGASGDCCMGLQCFANVCSRPIG